MCGRYVVAQTTLDLVAFYGVDDEGDNLPQPGFNVRPTDPVPIVVDVVDTQNPAGTRRRLEAARWSLIPPFAREARQRYSTFNARSETAARIASFHGAVARTRCLVPSDGYYEWRTDQHTPGRRAKTPYFVSGRAVADDSDTHGEPLSFAGLYSWWADPAVDPRNPARWTLSATILTRTAPPHLANLHARTPVCLPADAWEAWLDPSTTGDQELVDAAVQASDRALDALEYHPVESPRGGAPRRILR
ncbi:SOS response-associated peptidase [Klugiella xanthotipulae]|uniref:Abasic site processing protein n=1 Tax=Klugiella xanthotipulae TaxID=244735 RepID=A0A543HXU5_9MICO|nr:SOS response-associated peptidase [Klugiella xanthotipulae]TQM63129.1 putative SOS response-associated peptidase YedK [Klugiella xanthotipulae]